MRRLFPHPAVPVDAQTVYSGLDWAPRGDRPLVALNMVSSADGRATMNGASGGIGSATDHALMMQLRANADALLHGAGTLRVERLGKGVPDTLVPLRTARGLAPQPLLALLTASGDVPLERAFFAQPERAIVFVAEYTPAAAVARLRARATVLVTGAERPDPAEALRVLRRDYGVRHVLCEGGPTLNHALLEAGLLDELFLTLAPRLIAGDGPPVVRGAAFSPTIPLSLLSLHEHENELYLRYSTGSRRL